ncbi:Uncharacterized protein TCAP_03187 [Tolypocladium capitatum]|uniref:Uncharacterized protein n=1 Tax=Tolypocladium capitatum TaxID=45235 RepID=A0A2K3QH79_9HYPO|nr:Uncharacterized protein TCAP_03187 [Tolypocladium capitatum]
MPDAEKKCVCQNRSFNVARVAGLCASCVAQAGDQQNGINVIMSTCNFSPQNYSPNKDRDANNVNVVASVTSAAARGRRAGVAGAVCSATAAAMLLVSCF